MKKLLVFVLCFGLASNAVAALSPLRTWQCRPSNPRPDCSQAEKYAARRTFIRATTGTLVTLATILTALGFVVGIEKLRKEQQIAAAGEAIAEVETYVEKEQEDLQKILEEMRAAKEEAEKPYRQP